MLCLFANHRAEIAYPHSFLLPLAKQLALIFQELDPRRQVSAVKIGVDPIAHLLQKVRHNLFHLGLKLHRRQQLNIYHSITLFNNPQRSCQFSQDHMVVPIVVI